MTTAAQRRARQQRIKDKQPAAAATPRPIRRDYAGGGGGGDSRWMILRIVDTSDPNDKSNYAMYGHYIDYTDPAEPVEDETEVVGVEFVRVYPPQCVQYDCFSWMVRALETPLTFVPLTITATTEEIQAALAEEILKSNAYPVKVESIGGRLTAIPPIWADKNPTFVDETRQMNEGSGI